MFIRIKLSATYYSSMILILLWAIAVSGQTPYYKAVSFPKEGQIQQFHIACYTFFTGELTNCYLLIGKSGQAILVDPPEQLAIIPDKSLLADKHTGSIQEIPGNILQNYETLQTSLNGVPTEVKDPLTGETKLVYDLFRPTNTIAPQLLKYLKDHALNLKMIILTHGHLDHIGAIGYLQKETGAKIAIHEGDLRGIHGEKLSTPLKEGVAGYPKDTARIQGLATPVDKVLQDNDLIEVDGMALRVIHTPGHSPGSICLLTKKENNQYLLFSGDTLLHWSLAMTADGTALKDNQGKPMYYDTGRTNFLDGSGNEQQLYQSIHDKLLTLPESTIVYPGHYEPTTIGEEKKYSPARAFTPEKAATIKDQ